MTANPQKHMLELGIEFLAELLLFLYPYGAEQMGLPHNFWLGLGCWIVGTAIAIRMFWIFPVWADRLCNLVKGVIAVMLVVIFVAAFYKPVMLAYSKRNVATEAKLDTKPSTEPAAPVEPKSDQTSKEKGSAGKLSSQDKSTKKTSVSSKKIVDLLEVMLRKARAA